MCKVGGGGSVLRNERIVNRSLLGLADGRKVTLEVFILYFEEFKLIRLLYASYICFTISVHACTSSQLFLYVYKRNCV